MPNHHFRWFIGDYVSALKGKLNPVKQPAVNDTVWISRCPNTIPAAGDPSLTASHVGLRVRVRERERQGRRECEQRR